VFPLRHRALWIGAILSSALSACGTEPGPGLPDEAEPVRTFESVQQGLVTCDETTDTGYVNGMAFTITLVTADGKPAQIDTANAYAVMQDAAAAAGIQLVVISGFRTMAEQQYLYSCYVNCNCNNCNLAAQPGYSNHQSGHALDLNTSDPGVYNWLTANAGSFGFQRTVPSEIWHWEWWSGGPGGGPCGNTPDNCTNAEASGCGNFGCGCVDHQCNGVFCPGSGCSADHAAACGAFGCNCADGACNGGTCEGSGCTPKETMDCAGYGSGCVDHQCNGGTSPGTGCTWREAHDCAAYGSDCVDHQCNGGTATGSGCTWRETHDCAAQGCGCVDHQCNGGDHCAGTGCTWRETHDCGAFGVNCADHMCSGGFGPGNGCTPKETNDCAAMGQGCVDHACSDGCTARETIDCADAGGCTMGTCAGGQIVDAGAPFQPPDDGGMIALPDAGVPGDGGGTFMERPPDEVDPTMTTHGAPDAGHGGDHFTGGCSAVPGSSLVTLALAALLLRNRRARRTARA
jgi:hypothetical protein